MDAPSNPELTLLEELLRTSAERVPGSTDERILDGALEAVAAYGPRRLTAEDIARCADVGRATVFRRFGSVSQVLHQLWTREVSAFLREAASRIDRTPDEAERVIEAFTLCVRTAQRHPWVSRLVRTDPGQLLDLLRAGEPSPLQLGRVFVAEKLRQDHPVAAGADERLAELLIRLAVAYAVLPSDVVDFNDNDQLRSFATEMILPIVTNRGRG